MKIIDVRQAQKATKKTNKDRKEQGGTEAIMKGSELNAFVVHLEMFLSPNFKMTTSFAKCS